MDQFPHGFYFVDFLLFSRNIIRAKNHKNWHPGNLMCAKCQEKKYLKNETGCEKVENGISDFHVFTSLKTKTPIRLSMFFMLCDCQTICVKFCELFICEIKSAWKIVRKSEGRVLVLRYRSVQLKCSMIDKDNHSTFIAIEIITTDMLQRLIEIV